MNKNTVSISLVGVAFMAALLLAVSEGHAKKPADHNMENMDHMEHMDHAGHAKESAKTPQQKEAMGFLKKADAMCNAGQFEDSLPVYTQAIALDPKLVEAYFKRGKALYRLGADLSAIEDFSKVIELNPDSSEAYFQRGVVWYSTGDEEKMLADFKAAARLASMDHTSHVHVLK
ncbi:MAG: tetratricopeptide repeat protein [Nitrospinae bacterium]|nr:tetratricopeptide repeat protein [Nitrospinota bacterium]